MKDIQVLLLFLLSSFFFKHSYTRSGVEYVVQPRLVYLYGVRCSKNDTLIEASTN
jgi:hypothetical protein